MGYSTIHFFVSCLKTLLLLRLSCCKLTVFSFSSRWHPSNRKGPYVLYPISQQSPQGCPQNSADICLVEHRSFLTLEGRMLAASFLHSSFLQAIYAVMLWPIHVQEVPQASEHLYPAKPCQIDRDTEKT